MADGNTILAQVLKLISRPHIELLEQVYGMGRSTNRAKRSFTSVRS